LGQDFNVPIKKRKLTLSLAGHIGQAEADGRSADNDFWGIAFNAKYPIAETVKLFGRLNFRQRDYDNPSIRSVTGEERFDETWTYCLGAQWQASEGLTVNGYWQHTEANSNLDNFFEYGQDVFGLSIQWQE